MTSAATEPRTQPVSEEEPAEPGESTERVDFRTGPLMFVAVLFMLAVLALVQFVSLTAGLIIGIPLLVGCLALVIRSAMRVMGPEDESYPGR